MISTGFLLIVIFMISTLIIKGYKTLRPKNFVIRLNMERIILNNPVSEFDKVFDKAVIESSKDKPLFLYFTGAKSKDTGLSWYFYFYYH